MYCWNFTKTLSNPNDPEWEMLIKLTLGDEVHSDRKKSFILAREALKNCLKDYGLEVLTKDLILKNHCSLEKLPQLAISLSHTKGCGAAMVAERKNILAVGIDIEHEERHVKDSIIERIGHPEDDSSLRKIELWCLKEAAFKTLMNTGKFPRPVEFSSIEIGKHIWSHSPSKLQGEWELDTVDSIVIARAFLKS